MNDVFLNSGRNSSNEVLTKTYGLLALTLVPTVAGAILGVQMGLVSAMHAALGGIGFFIAYLVAMFALIFSIQKSGDTPLGVSLLMVFTFISGVMLSVSLQKTLAIPNGSVLIATAFGGTAAIFAGMATLNKILNRDLGFMGKGLFIALIALLVCSILFMFFPSKLAYVILTGITLILFSVYLLYDLNQITQGGETSYVSATLNVYLDLINIFRSLLSLLGIFGNSDD